MNYTKTMKDMLRNTYHGFPVMTKSPPPVRYSPSLAETSAEVRTNEKERERCEDNGRSIVNVLMSITFLIHAPCHKQGAFLTSPFTSQRRPLW